MQYNSWRDPVSVKISKLLFQVYPSVQPHDGSVIRGFLLDHRSIACLLHLDIWAFCFACLCLLHLVIWAYLIQSSHLATLKYIIIIGKNSFGVKIGDGGS